MQATSEAGFTDLLTGRRVDENLAWTDPTGAYTVITDALGSTIGLAGAAGTLQTEYTYAPFGATAVAGAPSSNASQYTGRENDGTGLYYYRARYYHPSLARFIAEDPHVLLTAPGCASRFAITSVRLVNEPLGWSLYTYAANSPIDRKDPLGLVPVDKGAWKCPSTLCIPRQGCTTDAIVGTEVFRLDERSGQFTKWIRCTYRCKNGDDEQLRRCEGPYF